MRFPLKFLQFVQSSLIILAVAISTSVLAAPASKLDLTDEVKEYKEKLSGKIHFNPTPEQMQEAATILKPSLNEIAANDYLRFLNQISDNHHNMYGVAAHAIAMLQQKEFPKWMPVIRKMYKQCKNDHPIRNQQPQIIIAALKMDAISLPLIQQAIKDDVLSPHNDADLYGIFKYVESIKDKAIPLLLPMAQSEYRKDPRFFKTVIKLGTQAVPILEKTLKQEVNENSAALLSSQVLASLTDFIPTVRPAGCALFKSLFAHSEINDELGEATLKKFFDELQSQCNRELIDALKVAVTREFSEDSVKSLALQTALASEHRVAVEVFKAAFDPSRYLSHTACSKNQATDEAFARFFSQLSGPELAELQTALLTAWEECTSHKLASPTFQKSMVQAQMRAGELSHPFFKELVKNRWQNAAWEDAVEFLLKAELQKNTLVRTEDRLAYEARKKLPPLSHHAIRSIPSAAQLKNAGFDPEWPIGYFFQKGRIMGIDQALPQPNKAERWQVLIWGYEVDKSLPFCHIEYSPNSANHISEQALKSAEEKKLTDNRLNFDEMNDGELLLTVKEDTLLQQDTGLNLIQLAHDAFEVSSGWLFSKKDYGVKVHFEGIVPGSSATLECVPGELDAVIQTALGDHIDFHIKPPHQKQKTSVEAKPLKAQIITEDNLTHAISDKALKLAPLSIRKIFEKNKKAKTIGIGTNLLAIESAPEEKAFSSDAEACQWVAHEVESITRASQAQDQEYSSEEGVLPTRTPPTAEERANARQTWFKVIQDSQNRISKVNKAWNAVWKKLVNSKNLKDMFSIHFQDLIGFTYSPVALCENNLFALFNPDTGQEDSKTCLANHKYNALASHQGEAIGVSKRLAIETKDEITAALVLGHEIGHLVSGYTDNAKGQIVVDGVGVYISGVLGLPTYDVALNVNSAYGKMLFNSDHFIIIKTRKNSVALQALYRGKNRRWFLENCQNAIRAKIDISLECSRDAALNPQNGDEKSATCYPTTEF